MNKRGPLLLIDADVLRYQLAFSNTANIDWNGDGNKVEAIQPERAKAKLEDYIDEIVEKFGARPLRRAIQRYLEDPLSEKILGSEFSPGDEIEVTVSEDRQSLAFRVPSKTQTV